MFPARGPFLEAPGDYRGQCTVKLPAEETKFTSLAVRTHPSLPETLISKYDFGPGKLLGLSRNGSQRARTGGTTRSGDERTNHRATVSNPKLSSVSPLN